MDHFPVSFTGAGFFTFIFVLSVGAHPETGVVGAGRLTFRLNRRVLEQTHHLLDPGFDVHQSFVACFRVHRDGLADRWRFRVYA